MSALNAKKKRTRPWIVDSGASDHMTGDVNVFDTYDPCSSNYFVSIADGLLSKVVGFSSMAVSKDLTLHFVLLVPNLDCNLLSISKLTKYLKCVTKFFPNHYEFQIMDSGMMIGNAKMHEGLYLLRANEYPNPNHSQANNSQAHSVQPSISVLSIRSDNKNDVILLWHYRLGHPNFVYLEKMFPSLLNKNSKSF